MADLPFGYFERQQQAAQSNLQQLANTSALAGLANAGGLAGATFGQLCGGTTTNVITIATDNTSGYFVNDPYQYAINIQQPIVPQVQDAIKKAKRHFASFLDELRTEIQEWHGDLRTA